jgi:magnesium chelatase accessory protein
MRGCWTVDAASREAPQPPEHLPPTWPLREHSRFVEAGGLRWHVQVLGHGPPLLLVHGTGASAHSWAGLARQLAGHFLTVIPDLPGHGFTARPTAAGMSLPGMATGLAALLDRLEIQPALAAGHSAGAAVLARMALDGRIAPRALLSFNGALLPLRGMAGQLFSPLAKLVATSGATARLFAWRVRRDPAVIRRMLDATGSTIDAAGADLYRHLAGDPEHVAAALGMMANWDLEALARDLPRLPVPLVLVVGTNDRTVRPSEARRVQALLPQARLVPMPGLGHLAHEEQPAAAAEVIRRIAAEFGVVAGSAAR